MPSWRQAAQARLDAATPGEWSWENILKILRFGPDQYADHGNDENNALFIAHAPTDLRRALRLLADAGKMASGVKYALSNWQQSHIAHVDPKDVMDILDAFLAALDEEEKTP